MNFRVSGLPLFPKVPAFRSTSTEPASGASSPARSASSAAETAGTSSFCTTMASRARVSGNSTSARAT
ncbi:hypothetical protein ACWV95_16490 [Streptomyces albus]